MGWGVMEAHTEMQFQPALRRLVFVDVEIVENHVQVPSGKASTTSLRKRRSLTEVRRCLTWATTWPPAISSAASKVWVPWRTYSLVQLRGFLALNGGRSEYGPAPESLSFRRHPTPTHFLADSNQTDNIQQLGFKIGIGLKVKVRIRWGCKSEATRIRRMVLRGSFKLGERWDTPAAVVFRLLAGSVLHPLFDLRAMFYRTAGTGSMEYPLVLGWQNRGATY